MTKNTNLSPDNVIQIHAYEIIKMMHQHNTSTLKLAEDCVSQFYLALRQLKTPQVQMMPLGNHQQQSYLQIEADRTK